MRCVACGESHDCSHRIWFARTAGAAQNKWVVEMSTGMPLTVTCRRIASNGCDGSLSMSVCDSPSTGSHVRIALPVLFVVGDVSAFVRW